MFLMQLLLKNTSCRHKSWWRDISKDKVQQSNVDLVY